MKTIPTSLMTAAMLTVFCLSATAQDKTAYVDDRSDGPALIRSLYNAINRKEYARLQLFRRPETIRRLPVLC